MKMRFKLVSVSAPIVALGISFGLSSLILLVIGKDPLETFQIMFGKVVSLFKREIRLQFEFSIDIKKTK